MYNGLRRLESAWHICSASLITKWIFYESNVGGQNGFLPSCFDMARRLVLLGLATQRPMRWKKRPFVYIGREASPLKLWWEILTVSLSHSLPSTDHYTLTYPASFLCALRIQSACRSSTDLHKAGVVILDYEFISMGLCNLSAVSRKVAKRPLSPDPVPV